MSNDSAALYVVATPIGNLEDMGERARRVLSEVDLILAEDTRLSARLLKYFGIDGRLRSLHEHNEAELSADVVARLQKGVAVALISDAGTPLVSDPGYVLVRAAHAAGIRVLSVPGPCAAIAALSVSGLPTDRFVFEGFLPAKQQARRRRLAELRHEPRTLILYEAPHRLEACVADLEQVLGGGREVTLARELTKLYETVHMDRLGTIGRWLGEDPNRSRGELVLVIEGAREAPEETPAVDTEMLLDVLLRHMGPGQAASAAAEITGAPRRRFYDLALARRRR